MIDTRCYECTDETRPLVDRIYEGHGKFKCPRCNHILDLSKCTYTASLAVGIDKSISFIKLDDRIKDESIELFIEDFACKDYKLDTGIYTCEIYWCYSQCGGYEYPGEYDFEMDILNSTKINILDVTE